MGEVVFGNVDKVKTTGVRHLASGVKVFSADLSISGLGAASATVEVYRGLPLSSPSLAGTMTFTSVGSKSIELYDEAETKYYFSVTAISGVSANVLVSADVASESELIESIGIDNFVLNPTDNSIDATASQQTIMGAGSASQPNKIGEASGIPVGADFTPGDWTADSGYVAGSTQTASINGGYDNVVNAIASSTIGSNHCFVKYNTDGHSSIIGSTYCLVASGRSFIFGSRDCHISSTGHTFDTIIGSQGASITDGDDQAIISSENGVISSPVANNLLAGGKDNSITNGSFQVVVGGQENDITSTGSRNFVAGGRGVTVSGAADYAGSVGGLNISIAEDGAVNLGGEDNTNAEENAITTGNDAVALSPNSIWTGAAALNEAGDCQIATVPFRTRTTDATITSMTCAATDNIRLTTSRTTTGTFRVMLTGLLDGSADGNNDAIYTQVSYTGEFGFYWDGTNGFLFDAAGESTVTTGPTRNLTLISQTNNDFTAGAAPLIAISAGQLRVRVTGIAATTINWVARVDLVMTMVD